MELIKPLPQKWKKRFEKVGDLITLYNRGNSLIDYIKAPFFTLTWVALLIDWVGRTFGIIIHPVIPIIIAFVLLPASIYVAYIDRKKFGIWQRQYYYEFKYVNPYFEERFDKIEKLLNNKQNNEQKL